MDTILFTNRADLDADELGKKCIKVKSQIMTFSGDIINHCHNLQHEDEGMMTFEYADTSSKCECGGDTCFLYITTVIVGSILGGLFCCACLICCWRRYRCCTRKREEPEGQLEMEVAAAGAGR